MQIQRSRFRDRINLSLRVDCEEVSDCCFRAVIDFEARFRYCLNDTDNIDRRLLMNKDYIKDEDLKTRFSDKRSLLTFFFKLRFLLLANIIESSLIKIFMI